MGNRKIVNESNGSLKACVDRIKSTELTLGELLFVCTPGECENETECTPPGSIAEIEG